MLHAPFRVARLRAVRRSSDQTNRAWPSIIVEDRTEIFLAAVGNGRDHRAGQFAGRNEFQRLVDRAPGRAPYQKPVAPCDKTRCFEGLGVGDLYPFVDASIVEHLADFIAGGRSRARLIVGMAGFAEHDRAGRLHGDRPDRGISPLQTLGDTGH